MDMVALGPGNVSWVWSVPSTFIVQSCVEPPSPRVNAIRLPLGEKAVLYTVGEPWVSCL